MSKTKNEKKSRKLIFQTLLLTAGLFAVVLIVLISISAYYSYRIYLTSREELMETSLRQLGTSASMHHPFTFYMDRWEADIDSYIETPDDSDIE